MTTCQRQTVLQTLTIHSQQRVMGKTSATGLLQSVSTPRGGPQQWCVANSPLM